MAGLYVASHLVRSYGVLIDYPGEQVDRWQIGRLSGPPYVIVTDYRTLLFVVTGWRRFFLEQLWIRIIAGHEGVKYPCGSSY